MLTGTIPPEIGNLKQLESLGLAYNELTGTIPEVIGQLTRLKRVIISYNRFEGCIPDPLRSVENNDLRRLNLPNCGFNPSDPDDRAVLVKLYNATNGEEWWSSENWLSDQPLRIWEGVEVDAQGKVTHLNLSGNNLKGTLIPEIGHLDQLIALHLGANELSGPIPSEIGNLERLEDLSLSLNHLSGQIPVEIARLDNLERLDLIDNKISGPIPATVGLMSNLRELELSRNNLSGAIPPELANLANLTSLLLSSNKLTGQLPAWVIDLNQLERLTLGENQLTGDLSLISEDLEGLADLRTFSIAGNDLSGCLPATLRHIEETDLLFSSLGFCNEPPRQPPITPDFIKWEVGDAVRATDERAARLGVQWLFDYAESIGWPIVGDDITVYLMTFEPLVYAYAIEDGTIDEGELEKHREFISNIRAFATEDSNFSLAHEVSDYLDRSRLFGKAEVLIHENIHTAFQFDIDGLYTSPSLISQHGPRDAPAWFTEGMASYFDNLITSLHSGRTPVLCRVGCVIENEVRPLEIPLSSAEERNTCEYKCGAFAIELLASMVGQRHIVDFYTLRRPGRTWHETFEEVFGISVPDFYTLYEQHREAGFPELNPPVEHPTQRPDNLNDRTALVAFYNSTHGDSWDDNTNWLSDQPLATWHGISINSNGRVQGISLVENGIQGTLPPEIGDLTNLKWLFLNGNQIRGTIPQTITQVTSLEDLWLGENQLGGTIPEGIGNMTSLQYLALDHNDIAGRLPDSIGRLSNLRELRISSNRLSSTMPGALGNLTKLELLELSDNRLSGHLPTTLGNLINLKHLALGGNEISGQLPASMMSMSRLQYLDLEGNDLAGPIPNNINGLKSLESLYLGDNRFTQGLPDSVGQLSNLRNLSIWDNEMTGTIPASLGNLTKLEKLVLGGNRFSGHLPATLGNLRNIKSFSVSGNNLSGTVPTEFSNMVNIEFFNLVNNQLTGPIPVWLVELEHLWQLYIAGNPFTGCIPPELFDVDYHNLDSIPLPKCS